VRSRSDFLCLRLLRHIFFGKPTPSSGDCPENGNFGDFRF
jgi:hypothetical protein